MERYGYYQFNLASEYSILAVLIIFVGVVVYLALGVGEISNDFERVQSEQYWSKTEVAIVSSNLNSSAGVLLIQNNLNKDIRVFEVGLGTESKLVSKAVPATIRPKAIGRVYLVSGLNYPKGVKGMPFKFDVKIRYSYAKETGKQYLFAGMAPLVGEYK